MEREGSVSLEIIHFGQTSAKPPLVLVHGSFCGAWIWEKYFPARASQGRLLGAALSLRGTGKAEAMIKFSDFGVEDFVADIAACAALFEASPVVMGHSLGGYLAQRFALDHKVSGLVLLASPSLAGFPAHRFIFPCQSGPRFEIARLWLAGQKALTRAWSVRRFLKDRIDEKEMEAMLPYFAARVVARCGAGCMATAPHAPNRCADVCSGRRYGRFCACLGSLITKLFTGRPK